MTITRKPITLGPQEWFAHLMAHGRVPCVDDDPKPWTYAGWLRYYAMEVQRVVPGCVDRYGWLAEFWARGKLIRDPIPQVHFHNDPAVSKDVEKMVNQLAGYGIGGWEGLTTLVDFMHHGLGLGGEPLKNAKAAEYLYRTLNLGPWLLAPYDYLGEFLAGQTGKINPHAFFPTPHDLCAMMIEMQMSDQKRDMRTATVNDPCMGTGRMLLHASNYSLFLSGQDIDASVLKIAKINGALYAPWLVLQHPPWLQALSGKNVIAVPPPPGKRIVRKVPPPPPKRK